MCLARQLAYLVRAGCECKLRWCANQPFSDSGNDSDGSYGHEVGGDGGDGGGGDNGSSTNDEGGGGGGQGGGRAGRATQQVVSLALSL